MAEDSWPSPDHSSGAVNDHEYEQLTARDTISGLIGDPTTALPLVYADSTGRQVKIRADRYAKVRGRTWWSGSTELTQALAANSSGQPRIDRIVLRYSRTTQNVRIAVLAGTPAATPAAPALTNVVSSSGVWEFPCARVSVPNGASTTTASQVTPEAWYVSDDGGVLCTAATHPPVSLVGPGVKMHEVDTGRVYASVGSSWVLLREDTGPLALAAASGWAIDAFSVASYRRVNGIVYLTFGAQRTGGALSAGTNVTLASLPAGFRPGVDMRTGVIVNQSSYPNAVGAIGTGGGIAISEYSVTIGSGRWVYFPSVSFPAVG